MRGWFSETVRDRDSEILGAGQIRLSSRFAQFKVSTFPIVFRYLFFKITTKIKTEDSNYGLPKKLRNSRKYENDES
jgi:hypothetical protein